MLVVVFLVDVFDEAGKVFDQELLVLMVLGLGMLLGNFSRFVFWGQVVGVLGRSLVLGGGEWWVYLLSVAYLNCLTILTPHLLLISYILLIDNRQHFIFVNINLKLIDI